MRRPFRGFLPSHPMKPGQSRDEVQCSHPLIQLLGLTDVAHPPVWGGVSPGIYAEQSDGALTGLYPAHHELEQSRLSGSVWPQNPCHPTVDGQRQIVDSDYLAVPLRGLINQYGWRFLRFHRHSLVTSSEVTLETRSQTAKEFMANIETADMETGCS